MDILLPRGVRRQFAAAEERRASLASVGEDQWPGRQLAAVQEVWRDATTDIPYYAGLVASGRAPRTLDSWQDLLAIPILERQILQQQPEAFLRRSGPPASFMTTAGSTGLPIRMGMNQAERDRMRVVKLSEWQQLGYTTRSRLFLIWGHSHLLGTGWRGRVNHWKRKAADAVLGYRRVDAYRLNRAMCEAYAEELLQFRPLGVIGYASALDLFARYTTAYRDRFRALGVRFVLSTSEAPPRPDAFARLEDLFGCNVVEEYGGAEFGQVAFNRGHEPFRVYADLNYLECLPGPDDGRAQPALVTALYPRYLPLIRYRVGDALLEPERLPNGHVPRFAAVAGRVNDVITLDSGDSIHSVAVFHCIHQERDVHSIQMVVADDGIEVCLVAGDGNHDAMEERIRLRMTQVHPLLAGVRFRYVDDLETTQAGKRRWYVDRRTVKPCAESPAS